MSPPTYTAFDGQRRLARGSLSDVAIAVKRGAAAGAEGPLLIFSDATGRSIDVDVRGTEKEVVARLTPATSLTDSSPVETAEPRKRGRPKLGVVAREVTLLPRHWEWLNAQPGGASVALRKLVEEARRTYAGRDEKRAARDAAYHFMSAAAGDLPGFEEAARALFADERERLGQLVDAWPPDLRDHVLWLAYGQARGGETEG
jgi:hypothetical protein